MARSFPDKILDVESCTGPVAMLKSCFPLRKGKLGSAVLAALFLPSDKLPKQNPARMT